MTMFVIKYGYMFRLFLSHPQANVFTEFRCVYRRMIIILYW